LPTAQNYAAFLVYFLLVILCSWQHDLIKKLKLFYAQQSLLLYFIFVYLKLLLLCCSCFCLYRL